MKRLSFTDYPHRRLSHYLFRYPAKFHPPVARKLIEEFSSKGDLVLDPFCGSGTLLVEAMIQERRSIGIDVDPLAVFVSRVKTLTTPSQSLSSSILRLIEKLEPLERSESQYDRLMHDDISLAAFERETKTHELTLPPIPNFLHWFRRYVIVDLALIQSQIDQLRIPTKHRMFLMLMFASIIRKSSNADPVPVSGLEVTSHMRRLEENGRRINPFGLLRQALKRSMKDWEEFVVHRKGSQATVEVKQADTMQLRRYFRRQVDTVITSPPYHQAVDYYRRHTLEMYWLRLVHDHQDRLQLRSRYIGRHGVSKSDPVVAFGEIQSPLARHWENKLSNRNASRANDFRHYISAMSKCVVALASTVKPGGKAIFVLGKNSTAEGLSIPSVEIFREIASAHLRLSANYWYPVKNRYMTYSRRNGANIDKEYVLVFEK